MRPFEAGSIFEIEATRQLLVELLELLNHLQAGPTSQIRFDREPWTLEERIHLTHHLLTLNEMRERDFFEDEGVGILWRLEHGEATAQTEELEPDLRRLLEEEEEIVAFTNTEPSAGPQSYTRIDLNQDDLIRMFYEGLLDESFLTDPDDVRWLRGEA